LAYNSQPNSTKFPTNNKEFIMNKNLIAIAVAAMFIAPAAYADKHNSKNAIDNCVAAAQAKFPGKLTSIRAEIEEGKAQYELDIDANDGKQWEVECDAKTGKILETEGEVAADDATFTSKAKVSLDIALKTALAKHPGAVMKTEYEVESDGSIAYEFDIKTAGGKLLEVEVDAISGKLSNAEEVVWQIGE
jgi:uncharacterized membrane protein YkoI